MKDKKAEMDWWEKAERSSDGTIRILFYLLRITNVRALPLAA